MERLLTGLNRQQREAVVLEHDGPVLVLAGAGCGKTLVLTRRIAFYALVRCDQDRILALTFTRKAAGEMASRLAGLPGIDPRRRMPMVTTFHGFAHRVLHEIVDGATNFERIGYPAEPRLITEDERLRMIASLTTPEERLSLGGDLFELDNMLARHAVHPAKLLKLGAQRCGLIAAIEARIRAHKQKQGLWDFGDLIRDTLELFDEHPDIRRLYASRYSALLIDEFQDTNPPQVRMLKTISGEKPDFFAVGDDDQAIYGFRGADTGPTVDFTRLFPGGKILKLELNYRSTTEVLDAANRIFRAKDAHYRKVLRTGVGGGVMHGPRPKKKHFDSQEKAAAWIRSTARVLGDVEKIPVSETALLFRTNHSLDWMRGWFEKQGVAEQDRPQLLTIHGGKGLEFKVVFLCDMEEEVFPHYRGKRRGDGIGRVIGAITFTDGRVPEDCDLEEEKRLFYVGVTRAKKYLFFVSAARKHYFGRSRKYRKSRFLKLV